MFATLLALLPAVLHLASQDSKPVEPAVLLERAKIAEELGEIAKADRLLALAAESSDAKISTLARARIADLDRQLGRGARDGAQTRPNASDPRSPMDRRFADALQRYLDGNLQSQQFDDVFNLVGEGALPHIRALIDDPNTKLAWMDTLFGLLGRVTTMKPENLDSIQALRQYAASEDPLIRRKAIKTLGSTSDPRQSWSRGLAGEFLKSSEADARIAAIKWLRAWPEDLAPHLSRLARDPDASVRATLVNECAARLSDPDREALLLDRSDFVRGKIVFECGRDTWPRPVETILRLALDPSESVAEFAVRTLDSKGIMDVKPEAMVAALQKLTKNPSAKVRSQLNYRNRAFRELGGAAIPVVLAMVNDDDPAIADQSIASFSGLSESAYSRGNIPQLVDAIIVLSKRFGVRRQDNSAMTPTDHFINRLTGVVNRAATKDDFPMMMKLVAEIPDLPRYHRDFVTAILSKASVEQLPIVAQEMARSSDPLTRSMLLERAVDLAAGQSKESEAALVPVLRTAIAQDQDPNLRLAGMRGVMRLGIRDLQKELLAALDVVAPTYVNPQDAGTMYGRAPREAMAVLLKLARRHAMEKSPADRVGPVLDAISGRTSAEDVDAVLTLLLDDEWLRYYGSVESNDYRVSYLCDALARAGSRGGFEALKRVAKESGLPNVRAFAIRALGNAKNPGSDVAEFVLARGNADAETVVRSACVLALGSMRQYNEKTAAGLEPLLRDPQSSVRSQVGNYLLQWNDPKAIAMWRVLLKDPVATIRIQACEGLGRFMVDDAVPELLELLADPTDDVRKKAKDVLERIRFYNEEKKRWQDWKRSGGLDPAEGIQKLVKALEDPDAAIRIAAIQSLGSMKAKEALPLLVDLLKKASGPEREALAKAIAKIND